jgi:hypothetical protein
MPPPLCPEQDGCWAQDRFTPLLDEPIVGSCREPHPLSVDLLTVDQCSEPARPSSAALMDSPPSISYIQRAVSFHPRSR